MNLIPPSEKAQVGLRLIEEAILELLRERADWVPHSEIQDSLSLRLAYQGHQGYFSGSIMEHLEEQKLVERDGHGRGHESRYRRVAS